MAKRLETTALNCNALLCYSFVMLTVFLLIGNLIIKFMDNPKKKITQTYPCLHLLELVINPLVELGSRQMEEITFD